MFNHYSIAIIGTVGIPASYGGFETLTENLVKYLSGNLEFCELNADEFYSQAQLGKVFKNF